MTRCVCFQPDRLSCRIEKVSAKDGEMDCRNTNRPVRYHGRIGFTSHERELLGALEALVAIAEAHLKKPASPKIATYDEMYGPLTTQDALAEPAEEPALPDVAPADPRPSF